VHEFAIASAIVNTVLRHAEGRRVTAVLLRVGQLRQVVPESLDFAFEIVSRDTLCGGARLDQDYVPAALRCGPCGREWGIDVPCFRCPECAGADIAVVAGDELDIVSIEVEEAACTASG
jgi:hydrogenase nickel incorporation protein HypA/HybF